MNKIISLFTYIKRAEGKADKLMVSINNTIFVSAAWLEQKVHIRPQFFSLLIGSSIAVDWYKEDDVIVEADKDKKIAEMKCTVSDKVAKDFSIEYSANLMVAMLQAVA